MKFYDREEQLQMLHEMRELSYNGYSRLTVVTGRRRIGKTTLIKEAYKDERIFAPLPFLHQEAEDITKCAHRWDEYPCFLLILLTELPAQDRFAFPAHE